MKFTSATIDGASKKLGNQVIAQMQKGKGTLRAYAKPRNPKTGGQQAQRDLGTKAVTAWQDDIQLYPPPKSWWDDYGEETKISGYNIFLKLAMSGRLSVEWLTFVGPYRNMRLTYTCLEEVKDTMVICLTYGTNWYIFADAGELEEGYNKTIEKIMPFGTEIPFWFVSKRIYDIGGPASVPVSRHAHWDTDEVTGTAIPAILPD